MTSVLTPAFSQLLRERTAQAHTDAENAPFLLALSQGRVTTAGIVGLLQRLVPVYDALEGLAEAYRDDAQVAPLLTPGLERAGALRADLAGMGEGDTTNSPAAHAYAERIRQARKDAPAYVAHHYTRYLGDLSGGQVIGAALQKSHGLTLSFFDFPELKGPAVKKAYRAHLDTLPWSTTEQEAAIGEADRAFAHNRDLAEELRSEVTV